MTFYVRWLLLSNLRIHINVKSRLVSVGKTFPAFKIHYPNSREGRGPLRNSSKVEELNFSYFQEVNQLILRSNTKNMLQNNKRNVF